MFTKEQTAWNKEKTYTERAMIRRGFQNCHKYNTDVTATVSETDVSPSLDVSMGFSWVDIAE